ncbi:MAG: hypothetical protein ACI4I4_04370 [Acutalibacteraceae bacterium]
MCEKNLTLEEQDALELQDIFTEDMTDKQKLDRLVKILSLMNNSGYSDSMAWELSTENPSEQALDWQKNQRRRGAMEREYDRLRLKLESYEGETDDEGYPHGKGKKYYTNGLIYEGEWNHGAREGFGIAYSDTSAYRYEGEWKNDKRHGKGVRTDYRRIREEGTFIDDILSSEHDLIVTLPDGRRLVRYFKDQGGGWGIKSTWLCHYQNGDTLDCDWYTYSYPEGWGVYTYADGGILKGYWNRGKKDGEFKYTSPDGKKSIRIYEDDVLVSNNSLIKNK